MKKISSVLIIASVTEISTANYLITAFRKAGCRLFVCSDVAGDWVDLLVSGAVDVCEICHKYSFEPDLIMFIEGGSMRIFPIGVEHIDAISAWYGIDTHMDYKKHLMISRFFDVTFVAQKQYVKSLQEDGVKQVFWMPLAFPLELLPKKQPMRFIDVAYIGSDNVKANPERHELIARLKLFFKSNFIGMAKPNEMIEIYSSSFVVFNKSVNNDINMRFFEAMGSGAVLVTNKINENGLDELFVESDHYLTYTDSSDLVGVISKLLLDKERCLVMGQKAHDCIIASHTYSHRVDQIFDAILKVKKNNNVNPDEYFFVFLYLGMFTQALDQLHTIFKKNASKGFRRYVSLFICFSLFLLARVVYIVEWVFAKNSIGKL